MANVRSKQGFLDLHKGRGKWKSYLFRVTGSTYLHYFGSTKMKEAKEQVFLSQIRSIEVSTSPPKGGKFVFEVKAKGIHWIISANTQEDMIQWMEAIQPNCTKTKHLVKTESMPTTSISPSPPPPSLVPHAGTVRHQKGSGYEQKGSVYEQKESGYEQKGNCYEQKGSGYSDYTPMAPAMDNRTDTVPPPYPISQTMPHPPVPQEDNPTDSLPPSCPGKQNTLPHPPRSRQSLSNGPTTKPATSNTSSPSLSLKLKTTPEDPTSSIDTKNPTIFQSPSGEMCLEGNRMFELPRAESVSPYIDPNCINVPPSPKNSGHHIKHKQASLPENAFQGTENSAVVSSGMQPPLDEAPELEHLDGQSEQSRMSNPSPVFQQNPYMELINPADTGNGSGGQPQSDSTQSGTDSTQSGTQSIRKSSKSTSSSQNDEAVYRLSRQFTPDQLELLLEMMKQTKLRSKSEGSSDPELSVGNRDLGYLVNRTANTLTEGLLVTLEDDPDSYDKRPSWAKAVNEEDYSKDGNSSIKIDTEAYNIPEKQIQNMRSIGHGQFGEVFKADYMPNGNESKVIPVAVKTTKKDCTDKEKKDLLREMAVMSCMVHPNIVQLYGVVTIGVPGPWVVLEYLPYGDLRKYLQKSGKKSSDMLVKYMVDVAMGMHYIAERGLVHRDLAARNVLVGEGELCKVADFGMLRELTEENSTYYSTHNIPCPIRWMPPEAISRRKFSVASDVWSFGILMWEMFNPKKMPYSEMDNLQVAMKVGEGYRLPTPRGCPPVVSRVMKSCWHTDPLKRPSFILITTLLTSKVSSTVKLPPKLPSKVAVPPQNATSSTNDSYY